MSLAFLSPAAANEAVARSPMERMAKAAGAEFEVRNGWSVAATYAGESAHAPVAWADVSHLSKWEVEGAAGEFGRAQREGDAWVCPLTRTRALVIGATETLVIGATETLVIGATETPVIGATETPEDALDVTCNYAALTILGPNARETIARFCALDLRPHISPPTSFRPGSIARQPGMLLVEAENRFLLLFGWALGEYMWTVVQDAAKPLGGAPVGVDALREAALHA